MTNLVIYRFVAL